jgi:hypothetical protein
MSVGTPRGRRAVTFTLDEDVLQLLRLLSPSGKGFGHVVDELVRSEMSRREERRRLLRELGVAEPLEAVACNA